MIDFQKVFHVGVLVADLETVMRDLSTALGLTWCIPHTILQPRGGGVMVELMTTSFVPMFEHWWEGGTPGGNKP